MFLTIVVVVLRGRPAETLLKLVRSDQQRVDEHLATSRVADAEMSIYDHALSRREVIGWRLFLRLKIMVPERYIPRRVLFL